MKLLDVNVLLYAVDAGVPQHRTAARWLEGALADGDTIALSWIVISGFLRMSTSSRAYPRPLTQAVAVKFIDELLGCPNVRIAAEGSNHWQVAKHLLNATGAVGKLVTDVHLAAIALSHNAVVVTCDSDFARFPGVRVENPLWGAGDN